MYYKNDFIRDWMIDMTTNSALLDIKSSLEDAGKIVNLYPQEKQRLGPKEVILTIGDVNPTSESATTYFIDIIGLIGWTSENSLEVVEDIKGMITLVEDGFTNQPRGFKFTGVNMEPLGVAVNITMTFMYKEVLQVGL